MFHLEWSWFDPKAQETTLSPPAPILLKPLSHLQKNLCGISQFVSRNEGVGWRTKTTINHSKPLKNVENWNRSKYIVQIYQSLISHCSCHNILDQLLSPCLRVTRDPWVSSTWIAFCKTPSAEQKVPGTECSISWFSNWSRFLFATTLKIMMCLAWLIKLNTTIWCSFVPVWKLMP